MKDSDRIAYLKRKVMKLENILAEGVHTCNANCPRPGCIQRRKIDRLEAENLGLIQSLRTLEAKISKYKEAGGVIE